ncbi:flagellar FliL protein [Bartonella schoenbuchensis R1]|uniref:Flagellar FliL protein n=2 Tax=Bartonella schoenbuchensis TaxID=165694 RepID=A0A1S6XRH9_BARSR|nr:flagellar FliL protein [Bartonella schoenbuchensis R1]
MNLRSDLFDRAKIRSDDKISNILISSLVIEQ